MVVVELYGRGTEEKRKGRGKKRDRKRTGRVNGEERKGEEEGWKRKGEERKGQEEGRRRKGGKEKEKSKGKEKAKRKKKKQIQRLTRLPNKCLKLLRNDFETLERVTCRVSIHPTIYLREEKKGRKGEGREREGR